MTSSKTSARLWPTKKAWKFFLVFFSVIGIAFLSFEYSMCYFIVNGVSLHSPLNVQRLSDCFGLGGYCTWEVMYCLDVPIVSQFVSNDIATGSFGLTSQNQNFSLKVNSYSLVEESYLSFPHGVGPCKSIPTPSYAWQFLGFGFWTSNRTTINALNSTVSSIVLTMTGTFRTNLYTQQITRSTTLECNFGIMGRSYAIATCGN